MITEMDVVITGIGVISPIGIGLDAFRQGLRAGISGVKPITEFDVSQLPVRIAGQVESFDAKGFIKPRKSLKVMSRDIQFGFATADMACDDAGLPAVMDDPDRSGVVFASDMIYGDLSEFPAAYEKCLVEGQFDFKLWSSQGHAQLFPLVMLKYLPNMAACHLAIARDARGPNNTISLGEASSLTAIGEAAHVIQRGWADVMIAGGTSSMLHVMRLMRLGAMPTTRRNDDPAAAMRPFDADRDGWVPGEGAATFILESGSHARRRGARILARIVGFASRFSADGEAQRTTAMQNAIAAVMQQAGWQAADVGHVNANGMSTIVDDRSEAMAIHRTLGDVPVTAPKSYFGNLTGGTGALELAATLVGLADGEVPQTLNYRRADASCPVNVVRDQPLMVAKRTAIALNQSRTGQTAALAVVFADE